MPFMDDLKEYKTRILRSLWESDSIRRIISESANIPDLTYEQFRFYVRNYAKNPDTVKEKGVYILFEVDPVKVQNRTAMTYEITFWAVISEDLLVTEEGVLSDILISQIDHIFNGNKAFAIGPLELKGSKGFNVPVGFYGRYVTYAAKEFNQGW